LINKAFDLIKMFASAAVLAPTLSFPLKGKLNAWTAAGRPSDLVPWAPQHAEGF
jgi:hypothetical protein